MFGIGRKITNEMINDNVLEGYPKTWGETFENSKYILIKTKFYQTEHAQETIAIIEDPDGSISIGIARAGKDDDKNRRISPDEGMRIAEGRAIKARTTKVPLIKKNYLRGLYAMRVENV